MSSHAVRFDIICHMFFRPVHDMMKDSLGGHFGILHYAVGLTDETANW
jgi:hypothetical protein